MPPRAVLSYTQFCIATFAKRNQQIFRFRSKQKVVKFINDHYKIYNKHLKVNCKELIEQKKQFTRHEPLQFTELSMWYFYFELPNLTRALRKDTESRFALC